MYSSLPFCDDFVVDNAEKLDICNITAHAGEGSYGEGIEVVVFDLLDDPPERKKVDGMPEGPEKEAARYIALN